MAVTVANKRCFRYCKDSNFKANHNTSRAIRFLRRDVSDIAKIVILKQITTDTPIYIEIPSMFPILQR
ncbi:hypothetical protein HMPREF0663_11631 [Hoylesella oralis ATCC 33269]|uniref:Uncharacterized protein n=1 Tax=Hoylesella oralis ATCC 33269 TaxID=873533 RepID=E7RR30_9BACT|nr:hypothetical protein HMPREF0663_11631 [Hoylesella oralis ATCC 33269]